MNTTESALFFFMDLKEETSKNAKLIGYQKANILEDYYFMIGCACQGRIEEFEELYEELLEEELDEFNSHLHLIKPYLKEMSVISKLLEDSKIAFKEAQDNESNGDTVSRLLKKNKVFMKIYIKTKDLYLKHNCTEF